MASVIKQGLVMVRGVLARAGLARRTGTGDSMASVAGPRMSTLSSGRSCLWLMVTMLGFGVSSDACAQVSAQHSSLTVSNQVRGYATGYTEDGFAVTANLKRDALFPSAGGITVTFTSDDYRVRFSPATCVSVSNGGQINSASTCVDAHPELTQLRG